MITRALAIATTLVICSAATAPAQVGDATPRAAAPTAAYSIPLKPLVIVVHGIGGGNREDGWSRDTTNAWGVDPSDVREITFTYEGRGQVDSYTDLRHAAQPWAEHVQSELARHLNEPANEGRPVIVVAHSWGTVMTKIAVEGGTTDSGDLHPLKDALRPSALRGGKAIDHLFTLGSPIGRDGKALDLKGIGVMVQQGRPTEAGKWTNVFAPDDPVSFDSWSLEGADNVRLESSWYETLPPVIPLSAPGPLAGLLAHMNIWTHEEVVRRVHVAYNELQAPQMLTVQVTSANALSVVGAATVTAEGPVTRTAGPSVVLFLHDLPPGRYAVTASAPGFKPRRANVLVAVGGENRVAIALDADASPTERASFYVEAKVINRTTGKPVQGATVILSGASTRSASTDAGGTATLEPLEPGRYTFTAVAAGYRRAERESFEVATSLRGTIRLTPEDPAPPADTLAAAAAKAGTEQMASLGTALPESYGPALPPVPVGVFNAPGPGMLYMTFTLKAAQRPELQYANGYGQGYRAEAKLMWDGVVVKDSLSAGELRATGETTKSLPITVRGPGAVTFTAVGEWTIVRQVDGKWVDGPGGDRRHYLPGQVTLMLRFVPAK